jgi:hypothetical protein
MPDAAPAENERLNVLVGTWKTHGQVLDDDGEAEVARVEGTDAYAWLGAHFMIHTIDVTIGGESVQGLEIIGPYDAASGSYPTRAYDDQGSVQTSAATVDSDGVWTFGADDAKAALRVADDGMSARADWVRSDDGGASWRPWMRIELTRQPESG